MTISSTAWPAGASCAAELRMIDVGQRDVPRGETLADLGEGGADHRLLLLHGGRAEAVLRGDGLRGEKPFARARRQEPRVAVAGEDHALQHIADGRRHGGASLRGEPRQAVGEERPRENHVALLVPRDEPEGLARDLVAALLEMTQAQVEVEL